MIYSKFGESDVYVYSVPSRGLVCGMCYFGDELEISFNAESTQEMIDHLNAHQKIGHSLPPNLPSLLLLDNLVNYPDSLS
jgi:hypothetical protein